MKKTKAATGIDRAVLDYVVWDHKRKRYEFKSWIVFDMRVDGFRLHDTYGRIMAFVKGTKYEKPIQKVADDGAMAFIELKGNTTGWGNYSGKTQVSMFLPKDNPYFGLLREPRC